MSIIFGACSWGQKIPVSHDTLTIKENFFGTTVEDPFRYFENKDDSRVEQYSKLQDQKAEAHFKTLPSAKKYQRYLERIDRGANDEMGEMKVSELGAYFYLKMAKNDYSWKIYYRASINEHEVVLFNPEKYDGRTQGNYEITAFQPSWDGSKVAISVSIEHGFTSEIILLDVTTRVIKQTGIENSRPGEYLGLHWTPLGDSFTYTSLSTTDPKDPKIKQNSSLSLYSVETGQSRIIFGNGMKPKTDNRLFPVTRITSSTDQYIIVYTGGPSKFWDSYYTSFEDLTNPNPDWKKLFTTKDNVYQARGKLNGSNFYFITETDSFGFTISSINLKHHSTEKIIKRESDIIKDFVLAEDKIYFTTSKYGISSKLFLYEKGDYKEIEIPVQASKIDITRDYNNSIWIEVKSSLNQLQNFSYKPETGLKKEQFYLPGNFPTLQNFVYELVEVESHDGAMVPMSIIHRKDMSKNGDNPVFSNSYGAYGSHDDISFQTHLLSFVSLGGVLVFPHIRGGGAKGKQWHEAGKNETKYNSWMDLTACMNYLVEKNYTQHSKITLFSESAGAISTAMAINKNPNLAGALIIGSGVLNPYRREAIYKSADFLEDGTMKDSTQALALIAMDPFLNIPSKTVFPSTLVLHGLQDDRIYLHEPLKFVAKMQKNNIGSNPVLLDIDRNGSHNSVTDFYVYFGRIFSFAFSVAEHDIGI